MDKVVYITGGTKGIGFGIAKSLLASGYKVALSGREKDSVTRAVKDLGNDSNVFGLVSDVRKYEDECRAIKGIQNHFGHLDILIANAGLGIFSDIRTMTIEDWHQMIDTNLTGVFHTLKAGVEELIKTKGYFITIASLAGINFFKGGSGYNASKFGVVGFSQSVMLDLRAHDVKVTTILPGSVTSHFNEHQPDDKKDFWKIAPSDIGELIIDLLKMNPRVLPSKIEVRPAKTADMY